jgi:hypothetical protein
MLKDNNIGESIVDSLLLHAVCGHACFILSCRPNDILHVNVVLRSKVGQQYWQIAVGLNPLLVHPVSIPVEPVLLVDFCM